MTDRDGKALESEFQSEYGRMMGLALVLTGRPAAAAPLLRQHLGHEATAADLESLWREAPGFLVAGALEKLMNGTPEERERLVPVTTHVEDWLERCFDDPAAGQPIQRYLWSRFCAGDTGTVLRLLHRCVRLRPFAVSGWCNLALALAHSVDVPGALAAGRCAIILDPSASEAWRVYAHGLMAAGAFAEALVPAARALALKPTRLERLSNAIALCAAGQPDRAEWLLRKSRDTHINVRTWLSQAMLARGRIEEALSQVSAGEIATAGQGVHLTNFAVCLAAAGRRAEALECQREAQRRQPADMDFLAVVRPYARHYLEMIGREMAGQTAAGGSQTSGAANQKEKCP